MAKLSFNADGSLASVDNVSVKAKSKFQKKDVLRSGLSQWDKKDYEEEDFEGEDRVVFLPRSSAELEKVPESVKSAAASYWSLHAGERSLSPLRFSNGKTQEDIVREIVQLIKSGSRMVFLHGACGTGKSAIALNVARQIGRASLVVPVKSLQRQYEEDYRDGKYVLTRSGKRMNISMITGRENHDSVFWPGVNCADPNLPDTIQISEKNSRKLGQFFQENPFANGSSLPELKKVSRVSVAPANPYWSPIVPASVELRQLKDAEKKTYEGLNGREFTFYHRKKGCTYYDQYQAYLEADVIIFNSAKYKIESALDRKPATDIEIIDEADEFLDSFINRHDLNLSRLERSLRQIASSAPELYDLLKEIYDYIEVEEKRKRTLGIKEDDVFHLKETRIGKILSLLVSSKMLVSEIAIDEANYANHALEVASAFKDFIEDTYVTYRKHDEDLIASLVTTNISRQLEEIVAKNKAFIFMSGTLHSEKVLEHIFGVKDFDVVVAEKEMQGTLEIIRTGKEFDCRMQTFTSGQKSRADFLKSFDVAIEKAVRPVLVHVVAFEDLPSEDEIRNYGLRHLISREKLAESQKKDTTGRMVSMFKQGLTDILFSTKCARGVDFPGNICRSIVFSKYPNPNARDPFYVILQRSKREFFWEYYHDKAWREFLQRIYRAVRSKNDHVFILSPDKRVMDAVREIQIKSLNNSSHR